VDPGFSFVDSDCQFFICRVTLCGSSLMGDQESSGFKGALGPHFWNFVPEIFSGANPGEKVIP